MIQKNKARCVRAAVGVAGGLLLVGLGGAAVAEELGSGGVDVGVTIEIAVPEQAEPGDHPAGVAASVLTRQTAGDGTALGVESGRTVTRTAGSR